MNTKALEMLCHTFLQSGMFDSALRCAKAVLRRDRESLSARGMAATAALESGLYDEVLELTRGRRHFALLLLRGAAFAKTGRLDEARRCGEIALTLAAEARSAPREEPPRTDLTLSLERRQENADAGSDAPDASGDNDADAAEEATAADGAAGSEISDGSFVTDGTEDPEDAAGASGGALH